MFNKPGEVLGLEGFISDISERKRSEEVSFQLASIVESSDDAIISMTLDGMMPVGTLALRGCTATLPQSSRINPSLS